MGARGIFGGVPKLPPSMQPSGMLALEAPPRLQAIAAPSPCVAAYSRDKEDSVPKGMLALDAPPRLLAIAASSPRFASTDMDSRDESVPQLPPSMQPSMQIAIADGPCGEAASPKQVPQQEQSVDPLQQPSTCAQREVPPIPMGRVSPDGHLIPTYEWRVVPIGVSIPRGLEVRMSLNGWNLARIPATWRLQVVAESQIDSYRTEVSMHTLVTDVIEGFKIAFGWADRAVELVVDGCPLKTKELTVGGAELFGKRLTARVL